MILRIASAEQVGCVTFDPITVEFRARSHREIESHTLIFEDPRALFEMCFVLNELATSYLETAARNLNDLRAAVPVRRVDPAWVDGDDFEAAAV